VVAAAEAEAAEAEAAGLPTVAFSLFVRIPSVSERESVEAEAGAAKDGQPSLDDGVAITEAGQPYQPPYTSSTDLGPAVAALLVGSWEAAMAPALTLPEPPAALPSSEAATRVRLTVLSATGLDAANPIVTVFLGNTAIGATHAILSSDHSPGGGGGGSTAGGGGCPNPRWECTFDLVWTNPNTPFPEVRLEVSDLVVSVQVLGGGGSSSSSIKSSLRSERMGSAFLDANALSSGAAAAEQVCTVETRPYKGKIVVSVSLVDDLLEATSPGTSSSRERMAKLS
jgi:hypothetical protein